MTNLIFIVHFVHISPSSCRYSPGVYGRSFALSNPSNHGVGAPTRGAGDSGQFTGEKGFISYYEVITVVQYNDTYHQN
jgi:hypothetical protein